MLAREFVNSIAEDITRRGFLQGVGAAAGVGAVGYGAIQQKKRGWESPYADSSREPTQQTEPQEQPAPQERPAVPKKPVQQIPKYSPAQLEAYIIDYASKHLGSVEELIHFMAQVKTETDNFKSLAEYGGGKDSYDGGKNYHGRGYIQLTHKYNYKEYGDMLGLDLVNNPDLLLHPKIAAQVSVASWKHYYWRNAKKIANRFRSMTAAVTKSVNGGLSKLKERKKNVDDYTKYFKENPPAMANSQKKPAKQ